MASGAREHVQVADAEAASERSTAGGAVTPTLKISLLLRLIITAIVILNVLNAVAIAVHHYGRGKRFFLTFSLDQEANVPSWFSSALLLTAAAVVAIVAVDAASRGARWGRHWAGLSLVYVALSLDETAELHERIGSWLRARFSLHGVLHYAGIIPALAFASVVGFTYVRFLRSLPRATKIGVLVAAAVYIFGAAGVEAVTGWWAENHGSESTRVLLVSTFEENLELAGTTIFIVVLLSYFANLGRPVSFRIRR